MDTRIVKSWACARACGLVGIDVGLSTRGPGFEPGWGPFFPKCIPWRVSGHLLDSNVFGLKKCTFGVWALLGQKSADTGSFELFRDAIGP